MKRFRAKILLFMLLCLSANVFAQHKITFEIENYTNDTLVIGNYIMDRQLVHDTLFAVEEGVFVLEDTLDQGVYLALTYPNRSFMQFLVSDVEKEFRVQFDYENSNHIKYTGSPDNSNFQSYIDYLNIQRPISDSLKAVRDAAQERGEDVSKLNQRIQAIGDRVLTMADSLIEAHPDYFSTVLLKSNKEIEMPEFGETEDERVAQYLYFKKHYFDFIDLADPRVLRTPFLFHRVNYFIDKLTPAHPDSVILAIDYLLSSMEPAEETYMYYLSHFLNSYYKAKIVGMDAVYVHLAENYYGAGKASWAQQETIDKIMDKAMKIKPLLIGKTAPDIQVYQEDGTPVSISTIDYEYLVLMFWAPDCGHCKKSMPAFVEFSEKYKEKGVKVFAICTKYRDKVKNCWESVKEKDMLGFINGADEFNRSDFKLKYNVDSTPKVFILDKDREIIIKNIGAEQLEQVFENVIFNTASQEEPKEEMQNK